MKTLAKAKKVWGAIPRFEFVDRKPKPQKKTGRFNLFAAGSNVKCTTCGQWMDAKALNGHNMRKHGFNADKAASGTVKTPAGTPKQERQKNPAKAKTNPPPKPTPKNPNNVVNLNKHRSTGTRTKGHTVSATQPIDNASTNPAQGIADELAAILNMWAARMPANFKAAEREAKDMGEAFRGVADAFRRRSINMVEILKISPSTVEPYDDAASKASAIADTFMEVSNRINAMYKPHIELVNDPNAPNFNFLDAEGER